MFKRRLALAGSAIVLALLAAPVGADQALSEEVTVTATLTEVRLQDSPASVVMVERDELDAAASPAIDDSLRAVPGFTLFRRASSRTANPTTQGVSLRGIGASGASRSLVLWDGIPLNDPFGGWVYWGRINSEAVQRIEVLRGGGSDIFGGGALAGVINVMPTRSDADALSARAAGGSDGYDASVWIARSLGAWRFEAEAERYDGEGYVLIDEDQRGAVDVEAFSQRTSAGLRVERAGEFSRYFARLSFYDEERGNGTPLQENATENLQLAGGASWVRGRNDMSIRLFGSEQEYEQTFSAISSDRSGERLTRAQDVPSDSLGSSAVLRRPLATGLFLVAGIEGRRVSGISSEQIFGASVTTVESGGTQGSAGGFVELLASVGPRLSLSVSGRGDLWKNDPIDGEDRSHSEFSPRINATFHAGRSLNVTASAYRSFRPPTLNELYRAFRVGNVLTLANPELEPELLEGYETGFIALPSPQSRIRVTGFLMDVSNPVANVTVSTAPDLITRERRNLGDTRSKGLEFDGELRSGRFGFNAGYLYVDATVRAGDPALVGRRVPQVPAQQATFGAQYRASAGLIAAVEVRWSEQQFEDDQNALPLRSYIVADAFASFPLREAWTVFGAVENIADEEIEAGRTPVVTLGPPRSVRAGVRWRR